MVGFFNFFIIEDVKLTFNLELDFKFKKNL
jgi:hypothetical protein